MSHLLRYLTAFCMLLTLQSRLDEGHAQTSTTDIVSITSPTGEVLDLLATGDDDGDGIENALEINGFTFDLILGLQPWNGNPDVQHYFTDPLRWSTDGDPYSDYMEVTGVNMPAGVRQPYAHPAVAARPVIAMYMDSYDVVPISTITDSEGNEVSEAYTNETSNEDQVGVSVTTEASLNPFNLASVSVEVSYSHTWVRTESTTNSSSINWSSSRTLDPSRAAHLKLRVFMTNLGSASAIDVTPTFNVLVGNKTVATITSSQAANILTPNGTSNSRYPAGGGYVEIDQDKNGQPITLTLNELKTIEAGAPLSIVVIQVEGKVVDWNETTKDFSSEKSWDTFENEIDEVTMTVTADLGDEERYRYQVYGGTEFYDPGFSLRDVLSLVFDVAEAGGEIVIQGRRYPDQWCLGTPSAELIQAWNDAGQPADILHLPARQRTILTMASPSETPEPLVDLALLSPDMREIVVSAEPEGGFPILAVDAHVMVDYAETTVSLHRGFGETLFSTGLLPGILSASGEVVVTDASGAETIVPLELSIPFATTCEEYAAARYSSPQDRPSPGEEAVLFPDGDPARPAEVFCEYGAGGGDAGTSAWIPRNSASPYGVRLNDGTLIDKHSAVLVGREGRVLRSEDEGRTWTEIEIEEGGIAISTDLYGVTFSDPNKGVLVGESDLIMTTADGGMTWQRAQHGEGQLETVVSIDQGKWLGVGKSIKVSDDGGLSWSLAATQPDTSLLDVQFKDSFAGIAVGLGGSMYRTLDGGHQWETIDFNQWSVRDLFGIAHVDGDSWVAVGRDGAFLSVDDGNSWSKTYAYTLYDVEFVSDRVGFATGYSSSYRTDDGGLSWNRDAWYNGGKNYRIRMYDRNRGVIVGQPDEYNEWESIFLFTSSSGGSPIIVTGIDWPEATPPGALFVRQNYPNPFRSRTTIPFELDVGSLVTVSVYDVLGREVAVLVNDVLSPGVHQAVFDQPIAAGVYFCRITAGSTTATRMMIRLE